MNDQQMDWANRKEREASWAVLCKRNRELYALSRYWKRMFYSIGIVSLGLILAVVLLLAGGCAMFDRPTTGLIASSPTTGPGSSFNSTSTFWILGAVVVAFLAVLGLGFILIAKIIDRVFTAWHNVRTGNGSNHQTEKLKNGGK